jgi:hypothetical protein
MRRVVGLGFCLAAMCALSALLAGAALAAETPQQERERAREIGTNGYIYGQPLLDAERVFKTSTSVTVPTGTGYAPVNQFAHFQHLTTTRETVVVAPNDDTLYAVAWVKLNSQPIVLRVPDASRFDVVELVSPWTENFANVGTEASGIYPPGNYLIAGPGTDEGLEEADGLKVIHSPYDRAWLIGRVVEKGPEDNAAALAIEEEMDLVPLRKWLKEGFNYKPPAPKKEVTEPTTYTVPGTGEHENHLKYWSALGRALVKFPPPAADKPVLEELASVNVGPGKVPNAKDDSKAVLEGLREAVSAGPIQVLLDVKAAYEASAKLHDGWLVSGAGKYGTNYVFRAEVDKLGIGALSPNVSIYPLALVDDTGAKLNGTSTRYVLHFPAGDFPVPVRAFWSLTLYEASGFLVSNPLERYALGNRSTLHFEPDGSLNVYVQTAEPATEAQLENWLPAPSGEFHLIMRLYGTDPEDIEPILTGAPGSFQPPRVEPCLETGLTAGGLECAT